MNNGHVVTRQLPRLPAARQFDRNCVLASTAGQIIAAAALGLEVSEIVVGNTLLKVGRVARDIKLAAPRGDRPTTVVAMAGMLGFCQAAGFTVDEIRSEYQSEIEREVVSEAAGLIQPWIDDGRFARLVRALDAYQFSGTRVLQ